MRIHDETIEVAHGVVDQLEAPARFWWRHRVWEVREIQARWVLTDPWWESAAARAVRAQEEPAPETEPPDEQELLTEREVWRVLATRRVLGAEPLVGIFELTRRLPQDRWRLTRIAD